MGDEASSAVSAQQLSAIRDRAANYLAHFYPTEEQLVKCYNEFRAELKRGLEAHSVDPGKYDPDNCSLMVLDSCVDTVPSGREKGVFCAIDFGGTNIRAIRCCLDGQGRCTMSTLKHNMRTDALPGMPKGLLDKKAPACLLFDDIAGVMHRLMEREGDPVDSPVPVGFTFSFGTVQQKLNCAILTGWTKGFETGTATDDPVVGRDVATLLNVAFARKGMKARVMAVLNDTVGALLSGNYCKPLDQPACLVGVILGTGVNGAYFEPSAKSYGYQGLVINTECGGFNKGMPFTDIDDEVDFCSAAPGRQRFEKMVSGMYVPEICRLLILRIFQAAAPASAWVANSLSGEACGAILNDSAPFTVTATIFRDVWKWTPVPEALPILHQAVTAVFTRSAAISASLIAGMCRATGRLQPAMGGLTVGMDGSLYTLNECYQKELRHYLEVVLGKRTADLVRLVIAQDGSGMGAAILVAAVTSAKKDF